MRSTERQGKERGRSKRYKDNVIRGIWGLNLNVTNKGNLYIERERVSKGGTEKDGVHVRSRRR